MDKYDAANDHYCYEGTPILKNKLGIKDENKLELAERDITNKTIESVIYTPGLFNTKERAWNNFDNYNAELLFQVG